MSNCTQTNIPELNLETETCNGKYYNTFCVIHKPPLVPLGFPQGNAILAEILPAISDKIFNQQEEIDSLNEQISEIQVGDGGVGLVWRGAWVSGSDYEQNDVVEYLGSSYICVVAVNNSVSNPLSATANWDLLAQKGSNGTPGLQGLIWRGIWNDDSDYDPGDAVFYNGSSYICTVQTTLIPPPSNLADWDLLAQSAEQEPQSAYTVKVNNTNATASPVETTYRSSGQQTLNENITFSDIQTPTGTVNASYNWQQIGNLVTMTATIEYVTYNVETGDYLLFPKPSDMPDPVIPTGMTLSSRTLYTGIGSARSNDQSINQDVDAYTISYLRSNPGGAAGFNFMIPYRVPVGGDFGVFRMTLQYFTS